MTIEWSPDSTICSTLQSNHAVTWSMIGLPRGLRRQASPPKRSSDLAAKTRARSRCPAARTLTAKRRRLRITSQLDTDLATQIDTSGGASDTEMKALAVKPRGVPSASDVVTIVTPVGNEL